MKKLIRALAILLTAMLLFAALPALADVILEPNSSFYEKHGEECYYRDPARYGPRGEEGLAIYDEPDGKQKATVDKGDSFYVEWFYASEDGTEWGYIERAVLEGWFKIEESARYYDHNDFYAEYGKECYKDTDEGHDIKAAVLYDYPCGTVKFDGWLNDSGENVTFSSVYKDEKGREWGFIGYYYGHWDGWICIDDPENASLLEEIRLLDPITGERIDPNEVLATHVCVGTQTPGESTKTAVARQTISPEKTDVINLRDNEGGSKLWTVIGVVAGAVILSALALIVFFKKPAKKE